jgi:hypothetical protein
MRQSDANLRIPQSADERAQTLATLYGMMAGPLGVWWKEGKASLAQDFVAEMARLDRQLDKSPG